jgi:hypothetical protein
MATRTGLVGIALAMRMTVRLDGPHGTSVLLGRNALHRTSALHGRNARRGMTGRIGGVPGKSGALSVGTRIRRLGGLRVRIGRLLMSGGIAIGGTGLRLRRVAILLGLGTRVRSLVLRSSGGVLAKTIFGIRSFGAIGTWPGSGRPSAGSGLSLTGIRVGLLSVRFDLGIPTTTARSGLCRRVGLTRPT